MTAVPPAGAECVYNERDRRCHEPAVWVTKANLVHPDWPLCERHSRPEFHPPDLRKHLPGRLRRALRRSP